MDIYVNPDGRIYKMVNRLATEQDFEAAKEFAKIKDESKEEFIRKKQAEEGVTDQIVKDKSK